MSFLDPPSPEAIAARRRFAGWVGVALLVWSFFVLLSGYDIRAGVMAFMALVCMIASRLW